MTELDKTFTDVLKIIKLCEYSKEQIELSRDDTINRLNDGIVFSTNLGIKFKFDISVHCLESKRSSNSNTLSSNLSFLSLRISLSSKSFSRSSC